MIKRLLFMLLTIGFITVSMPMVSVHASSSDTNTINGITNGTTKDTSLSGAESSAKNLGGSVFSLIKTISLIVAVISIGAGGIGIMFANSGRVKDTAWAVIGKVILGVLIVSGAAFLVTTALQIGQSFH